MQLRTLTTTSIAAAISMAVLMPANALLFGDAENVHRAFEAANVVEKTACWRFGWRGWGWYPFCGPPPPPPPAAWAYEPGCRDVTIREHHWGETEVRHIHRCD
jgi:hypothetical protein